jgi:hypothetical protein
MPARQSKRKSKAKQSINLLAFQIRAPPTGGEEPWEETASTHLVDS